MKQTNGDLPEELRALVRRAVAVLGEVIQRELGKSAYLRIENLRRAMAGLRASSAEKTHRVLRANFRMLERLSPEERFCLVHSYALMLELMNACENAYRTYRLGQRKRQYPERRPRSVVYVLTAHPTEARSPANISVFQGIQHTLVDALGSGFESQEEKLRHLLGVAWRLRLARRRKPRIKDEAEHIYSILLREETLNILLEANRTLTPVYIRTWVGGDKDGHPGVDEHAMTESLQLARDKLIGFARGQITAIRATLKLLRATSLLGQCNLVERLLSEMAEISPGDGTRARRLQQAIGAFHKKYVDEIGSPHPSLTRLQTLVHMFPALVVPLELREASDVMVAGAAGKAVAIARMLKRLGALARGGKARWYGRGLIISMASALEHVEAARILMMRGLGHLGIPIIPLFEEKGALENGPKVVEAILSCKQLRAAVDRYWNGYFEVMLGYSDSAKENGALASRLAIATAMRELDAVCRRHRVTPVFFHGAGGSVDRGGGSIEEQTAWWPASALSLFKATVQGEMVERTFSSPEITWGQLQKIVERFDQTCRAAAYRPIQSPESVHLFAKRVEEQYRAKVSAPDFGDLVVRATAYPYLSVLRIGSRPAKRPGRGSGFSVKSLRAIPWVMCWTQTRVLFPSWWGIGTAWKESSIVERRELRRAFERDPLFRSFVKLLGFTLAKVELPVWRIYLDRSGLEPSAVAATVREFEREHQGAVAFVRAMSRSSNLLWFRPWLGTSIKLRSPMIHPLNLVQIIALREHDYELIRETVTGISSGMMTTG